MLSSLIKNLIEEFYFINALLYNFHHHHRSLRIKTEQGIIHRTPAQAAGIATKRFSLLELLRLNPIAC